MEQGERPACQSRREGRRSRRKSLICMFVIFERMYVCLASSVDVCMLRSRVRLSVSSTICTHACKPQLQVRTSGFIKCTHACAPISVPPALNFSLPRVKQVQNIPTMRSTNSLKGLTTWDPFFANKTPSRSSLPL